MAVLMGSPIAASIKVQSFSGDAALPSGASRVDTANTPLEKREIPPHPFGH
jgi:hypothetical protein